MIVADVLTGSPTEACVIGFGPRSRCEVANPHLWAAAHWIPGSSVAERTQHATCKIGSIGDVSRVTGGSVDDGFEIAE